MALPGRPAIPETVLDPDRAFRLRLRVGVPPGMRMVMLGAGLVEASLFAKATWLFLAGTVASGVAVGLIFRGGLSEINAQAPPSSRAQAVSTFFAAAYLGLGLPVVLIGVITPATGTLDASAWVAGLVAAVILAAAVIAIRTFGKAPQATPRRASRGYGPRRREQSTRSGDTHPARSENPLIRTARGYLSADPSQIILVRCVVPDIHAVSVRAGLVSRRHMSG